MSADDFPPLSSTAKPAGKQAPKAASVPVSSKQPPASPAHAGKKKKKMSRVDPSLLGFASETQEKLIRGELLKTDE